MRNTTDFKKLRAERAENEAPKPTTRCFTRCPRCGSKLKKAKSYAGTPSEFWLECTNPNCNTFVNTYIPQKHQYDFHKDPHRFKGNFGGYGTGKTTTDREEFYKHLFITPNGNGLMGANIMAQYEGTIKRDIENDLPVDFVQAVNTQKSYMDFVNGYRLMYRPYDDAGKLRSLNLDFWLILEASEVKQEAYTQLKSRIRNVAATKQQVDENGEKLWRYSKTGVPIPLIQADWRQGIIESNPDSGWIKMDVLNTSAKINKYGTLKENYVVPDEVKDQAISSYIVASDQNEFLPPNFIDDLRRNKPPWWIARYVEGSFAYSEGLVYPNASQCICKTFTPPSTWKRMMAHDYGLVDPSVFLYGAVDPASGIFYVYKEVRTTNRSVKDLAAICKEASKDIPTGGYICPPIIDPKSGPKRDYDMRSLQSYYLDYGLLFEPGTVNVEARIYKTNTFIEAGQIRIMDCCKDLIRELQNYKFKNNGMNSLELSDKPEDKDNHSINCLEWMVMELPSDPKNILNGVYGRDGLNVADQYEANKRSLDYWALADEPDDQPDLLYTFGGLF